VRNEQLDLALAIPAASVRLTRDAGRIALGSPATVRVGARRTAISQFEGSATFDGRALHLKDVRLRSNEGSLRIDGALVLIARDAAVDLMLAGTADVATLARWAMTAPDVPRGTIAIEGHVAGALATPESDIRLMS